MARELREHKSSFIVFSILRILVLVVLTVTLNLIRSRSGRAIMAIRDNRIAAESIGINITKYKIIAFSIYAMFAGMAATIMGGLFVSTILTIFVLPVTYCIFFKIKSE